MSDSLDLAAETTRLRDLVRHQRGSLHDEGLITDDEYAALAAEHGAVARLEGYDALATRLAEVERERDEEKHPRDTTIATLTRERDRYRTMFDAMLTMKGDVQMVLVGSGMAADDVLGADVAELVWGVVKERDEAKALLDTWRDTLVGVLGEPARTLDDPAGMAANVIRTLRSDVLLTQDARLRVIDDRDQAKRWLADARERIAQLNMDAAASRREHDTALARIRELEAPGEVQSLHKLRAEVIKRDEDIAALMDGCAKVTSALNAAHLALEDVGAPVGLTSADRIRALAMRSTGMPERDRVVVLAMIDALARDYDDTGDKCATPAILRALRAMIDTKGGA